ncbi:ATP-dependent DNA helicase DinG [Pseudomonas aeruginosa]|nr:ATP-dependent DNA helicase DinG [Pseudomonas aeruginosa]
MLSAELKSQIQGAYTRFLEAKELKPRYGQRLMIAEVAKALGAIKEDEEGHREGEPAVVAVEPEPVPARPWPTAWRRSPAPRPVASAW